MDGNVGWGRAAVSRFAKSEEEIKAEILKTLEGKLSVEFKDYSQWQRLAVPESPSVKSSTKVSYKGRTPPSISTVGSRPLTSVSGTSACSSLCLHPWNKKEQPADRSAEIEAENRVQILKAQIMSRKNSVNEYKKLKSTILDSNTALIGKIKQLDGDTHQYVTRLLEKYEKYSSASKVLFQKHGKDVEEAEEDLRRSKEVTGESTEILEDEVMDMEDKLQNLFQDLQVLRTYKDKEYPVKAMCIAKLKNNVKTVVQTQKHEQNELQRIINSEKSNMETEAMKKSAAIMDDAAMKAYMAASPDALQQITDNNAFMAVEIEKNKKEIAMLENEILSLKGEVKSLKSMPETNVKKFVFPEMYLGGTKCHPDDDIILDIPVRDEVPL